MNFSAYVNYILVIVILAVGTENKNELPLQSELWARLCASF